ncbi:MAG: hypothetical protein AAF921_03525 [Cyanobacteria bacterium P01_D01_bin.44]
MAKVHRFSRRIFLSGVAVVANCLVSACAIASCGGLAPPPNQRQRVNSPNGHYQLSVPTRLSYMDDASKTWQVTIRENDYGSIVYQDTLSDFFSDLDVYWLWDDTNRVWLYNSNNGAVYVWEETEQGWQKQRWDNSQNRTLKARLTPPIELYPEYAK